MWQDLPLQGHAATGLRPHAVAGAIAMVDQLGHHPSIVTWNAHVGPAIEWMSSGVTTTRRRLVRMAEHQLPTPTKSVLDRWVKSAFERADPTRHVSGFTGVLPHLPRLEATATHLWFGWRRGSERDLADFAAQWPSQVRFVAEFGAQSLPDTDVIDPGAWPAIRPVRRSRPSARRRRRSTATSPWRVIAATTSGARPPRPIRRDCSDARSRACGAWPTGPAAGSASTCSTTPHR